MALSDFTDLQAAIANWLARPGDATLMPFIPDFIALSEARINRELRLRAMETRTVVSLAGAYTALPDGFLEMRSVRLNASPAVPLSYVTPEQLDASGAGSAAGRPSIFTIIGEEMRIGPAPDGAYEVEMIYCRALDTLSESQPTNRLLAIAPDVYLYASLIGATAFLMNDERLPQWIAAYETAVRAARQADDRGRWGGSALRVRGETAEAGA